MMKNLDDKLQRPAKRNRAKQFRSEIIEAAAYLFATRGFEETSMRDVAARVGKTSGALYYYFKSKDEMLAAVHERSKNWSDEIFQNAVTGTEDPWLRLEKACAAHLAVLLDHTDYASVVASALPEGQDTIPEGIIAVRDRHEELYRNLIDELPLTPDRDRKYFRLALWGALNYTQVWFRSEPASIDKLAHEIVKNLRYRMANKGDA